jgi:hypothetical protein
VSDQLAMSTVYVLTNPAMPGLVKIGRTLKDGARARLDQLYTVGVPVPFELAFACAVRNSAEVEHALHRVFAPYRVNPRRDFFKIDVDQVVSVLKLLNVVETTADVADQPSSLTPPELAATRELRAKRPQLNFEEMRIPQGSELVFMDGDAQAVVLDARTVEYNGEKTTLAAATRELLDVDYDVQVTRYWSFEGRPLYRIYEETYV